MSMGRALDERVRDEIVTLTRRGCTAREIADRLRISTRSVQRVRVAAGCAETRAPLLTVSEILAARELLEDGASYYEAGRTIGRCGTTIARNIPGFKFDKQQTALAAALGRKMARLVREQ